MAGSTYSTNLKIELMTTGENSGTWGDITNSNLGTAMEQAIIGLGNPDYISDANLTITITNSTALQPARALVLNVTSSFGSLTGTRELVVPTIQKQYIVQNNTTGGQSITVKTSAGTGITVPNGRKAHLYVNGTDVVQMFDFVDINGGAIDGATVGAASASTGAFTSLNASGATTLDGAVALGNAAADLITVPGTVNSNLLFTDNSFDIGANGATRPRNLFLSGAATVAGNLSVGGTLTLTGGVNLNGNVTVGDTAADTLTINATITSNLLFTDNTYDIGATGATRPRNLFLAGNATIGGSQTLTGALTVDSTTDSSSTLTGSIQTDGGLGVAKALYVGTTANIAGAVTLSGGTANGVTYLNGSKVLTSGSALTFDGTNLGVAGTDAAHTRYLTLTNNSTAGFGTKMAFNVGYAGGYTSAELQSGATGTNGGYLSVLAKPDGGSLREVQQIRDAYTFWNVAGSEQMRLTSTGLGIGTSSPTNPLTVGGGGNRGTIKVNGSNGSSPYLALDHTATSGGRQYNLYSGGINAGEFNIYDITAGANRLTIDSSGNLGLGVTPSAWTSGVKAAQIGLGACVFGSTASYNNTNLTANMFYNSGGSAIYQGSDFASFYQQVSGSHRWYTAPSGTAGAAITFTQAMTLDASGNLGVGLTNPSSYGKLAVNGSFGIASGNLAYFYNSANSNYASIACVDTSGLAFATGATERARIDSSGNFGLGVTPSAWGAPLIGSLQIGNFSLSRNSGGSTAYLTSNGYYDGANWKYINAGFYAKYIINNSNGSHSWYIAASGAAGATVTETQAMTLDASGNLLVGTTSNSVNARLIVANSALSALFYSGTASQSVNGGENAANAMMKFRADSVTNRSINSAGTNNASGADYAEYMTKAAEFNVAKGDVIGINAEGKLTNVFADAVSFCVKSTNPSYVGGDTWGIDFEDDAEGLEAARQTVDRIAFAGQVPVNVTGATAGQYIVPVNDNGAIKGEAVSSPTFEQYQQAVGKVIAIEADGRARIIVKVA